MIFTPFTSSICSSPVSSPALQPTPTGPFLPSQPIFPGDSADAWGDLSFLSHSSLCFSHQYADALSTWEPTGHMSLGINWVTFTFLPVLHFQLPSLLSHPVVDYLKACPSSLTQLSGDSAHPLRRPSFLPSCGPSQLPTTTTSSLSSFPHVNPYISHRETELIEWGYRYRYRYSYIYIYV